MTEQQVLDAAVHLIEAAGGLIIVVGAVWSFARFVTRGLRHRDPQVFVDVRLDLGRFLALGLEFQLAGDVLRTALSPSYREIGQLAAVAAIRTALNFFLGREIEQERRQVEANGAPRSTQG